MTVYVDDLTRWPRARRPFHEGSCHLTATSDAELHAFAFRIGLRRSWFQPHRVANQYDLTPRRREAAIAIGAVFGARADRAPTRGDVRMTAPAQKPGLPRRGRLEIRSSRDRPRCDARERGRAGGARSFDLAWARSIREQCAAARVACFVKQMGSQPMWTPDGEDWWKGPHTNGNGAPRFADRKGGDWAEWPEDLRVREYPR